MPSALLIHGIVNGPTSMWRFQEWLKARGYDVETKAQLGHGGRGPAPSYSLEAFTEDNLAMGDHDLVIGHSLGAVTATAAAAARPEWATRLVLVDPPWHVPPTFNGPLKDDQLSEFELTTERLHELFPHWDERDVEAKTFEAARALPEAVAAIFDENPDWDVRQDAMRLTMPTLVIVGDPAVFTLTPPDDVSALITANPNVTATTIAGTGHNPHRDDPAAVFGVLADWLA